MYVRFDANYKTDKQQVLGIFNIVGYLYKNYFVGVNADTDDEQRLIELTTWFSENLELPSKVRRSKNQNTPPTAIAWFKDTAHEHIRNLREISNIVRRYGVIVDFVRTDKPGYILYEDEFQVFAEPFKNK